MIFTDLDEDRKQVIDATSHVLVIGGPGSGKTTIALQKALSRINDGLEKGQKILFISFSRAAVARIISSANKTLNTKEIKLLNIQTFHSFFWSIVRSHGYLLGPATVELLLPQNEKVLSNGIKQTDPEWAAWLVERERLFYEEGKIAFDLFAPKALEVLSKSNLILNLIADCYPLIIIDEAQDTGAIAWESIELLSEKSQIICLADLEQQIFDHLPDIGPERLEQIKSSLHPLEVDLGGQNNRSAGTDILTYANNLRDNRLQNITYQGITTIQYDPTLVPFPIKMAVGRATRQYNELYQRAPESIGIFAPYGKGVARITIALNSGDRPMAHKVLLDETDVLLASRFVAYLLEPKSGLVDFEIAKCLQFLADIKKAHGGKSSISESIKYINWANQITSGRTVNCKIVVALRQIISALNNSNLTGEPKKDWLYVKGLLNSSTDISLSHLAHNLELLVAFNRGKRISANLGDLWKQYGKYQGALKAFDRAMAQDALFSDIEDQKGIHVMTIHKSKGKQFDMVIIVREGTNSYVNGWTSSFVWPGDPHPYYRSRRILRVGITRASKLVVIFDPRYPSCPILGS